MSCKQCHGGAFIQVIPVQNGQDLNTTVDKIAPTRLTLDGDAGQAAFDWYISVFGLGTATQTAGVTCSCALMPRRIFSFDVVTYSSNPAGNLAGW